jgi:hypothetical protein
MIPADSKYTRVVALSGGYLIKRPSVRIIIAVLVSIISLYGFLEFSVVSG